MVKKKSHKHTPQLSGKPSQKSWSCYRVCWHHIIALKFMCLWRQMRKYFIVYVSMILDNKSYTTGKPVYFPLNGATFVKKHPVTLVTACRNMETWPSVWKWYYTIAGSMLTLLLIRHLIWAGISLLGARRKIDWLAAVSCNIWAVLSGNARSSNSVEEETAGLSWEIPAIQSTEHFTLEQTCDNSLPLTK